MKKDNIGRYYKLIMGDGQGSFINHFEKEWNRFINEFPTKHKTAAQLQIGNRLRPCLVCWGYALSLERIEQIDFNKITDLAIGMELIHKGSIIIDDYIDDDSARRGKITFHKEYSANEAIIFLLFLLGKAIRQLAKYIDCERISNLICSMSEGALYELCLSHDDFFESVKINDIVKGETVALIKDSLLFGYEVNRKDTSEINRVLEEVACKCAHSFQMLNDLEPFSAVDQNIQYKDNHNFDFEKNRKNMIITRLYQACTQQEQAEILSNLGNDRLFQIILNLMEKYEIKRDVIKDVENSKLEMKRELSQMKFLIDNKECLDDFLVFIDEMINLCYLRV